MRMVFMPDDTRSTSWSGPKLSPVVDQRAKSPFFNCSPRAQADASARRAAWLMAPANSGKSTVKSMRPSGWKRSRETGTAVSPSPTCIESGIWNCSGVWRRRKYPARGPGTPPTCVARQARPPVDDCCKALLSTEAAWLCQAASPCRAWITSQYRLPALNWNSCGSRALTQVGLPVRSRSSSSATGAASSGSAKGLPPTSASRFRSSTAARLTLESSKSMAVTAVSCSSKMGCAWLRAPLMGTAVTGVSGPTGPNTMRLPAKAPSTWTLAAVTSAPTGSITCIRALPLCAVLSKPYGKATSFTPAGSADCWRV